VTTVERPPWLAAEPGATGTLRASGPVPGTVHLLDGRIAGAESPAVPSVADRVARSGIDGPVPRATIESAVLDALVAVRHGEMAWTDGTAEAGPRSDGLGWSLDEAAARVTAVVAGLPDGLTGDTLVATAVPRDTGTLSGRGWALTAGLDGPTSVLALARAAGTALHEALVEVDALLRGGFLTTVDRADVPAVLPRRLPGLELDLSGIPARDPDGRPFVTPDEHTLRRVLGLLHAL
jgi:hypothetical protein